jgi:hypothetical protein
VTTSFQKERQLQDTVKVDEYIAKTMNALLHKLRLLEEQQQLDSHRAFVISRQV